MDVVEGAPIARPKLLAIGAVAVLLGLVLRTGWVTEDAYITLRTVDNWVNGYGLRWNIDERVQAYTHPLWMLLLSAGYVITREAFTTTVILGVLTTGAAACTLVYFARTAGHAVAAVVLLTLSRAFIEYSTSGLENPLSHLLIILFVGLYVLRDARLWKLALVAALIALNRVDATIVVMPALVEASWRELRALGLKSTVRALLVGFSPFLAWEVFSVVYYGFPWPNTAYAKLNTGIPRLEALRQGLTYWIQALAWDPSLHIVALCGVATAILQRRRRDLLIALGILGYMVYVVAIGGDFMQGRFWTLTFFTGVCLVAVSELPLEDPARAAAVVLPFAFLFLHPLATEVFPIAVPEPVGSGIADERSYFRDSSSLMMFTRNRSLPTHTWFEYGRDAKAKDERTVVFENIGYLGFAAGPHVHIVDHLALSDPLMARMPMQYRSGWRVGHYVRYMPPGFREMHLQKDNHCTMPDRNLCEYYFKLREVVAGPIFSWSRFKTLIAMNLGMYDSLIDRERYRFPNVLHEKLARVSEPIPERAPWNHPNARELSDDGIEIELPEPSHAKRLEISFDGNDGYEIQFRSKGRTLARYDSKSLRKGLMHTRQIPVPEQASKPGFDRLLVRPHDGDSIYSLGWVRLHAE